ncbi:hypothetical protein HZA73_03835 [candidate division TA06 bacterium]|nr:hypothetical protein [candidate division TA06 bacterium]
MKRILILAALIALVVIGLTTTSYALPAICYGRLFLGSTGHNGATVKLYSADWTYLDHYSTTVSYPDSSSPGYFLVNKCTEGAGYYNLCIIDGDGWEHYNFYYDGNYMTNVGNLYLHTTKHPVHNYLP